MKNIATPISANPTIPHPTEIPIIAPVDNPFPEPESCGIELIQLPV